MGLYKLSQIINEDYDKCDVYKSCIVCAPTLRDAKLIHPSGIKTNNITDWSISENIQVDYLGEETSGMEFGTVICACFNAG